MEGYQMRVMQVIAGNVLYNVRKIENVNNAIWVKDTPPSPALPASIQISLVLPEGVEGTSKQISITGRNERNLTHVTHLETY